MVLAVGIANVLEQGTEIHYSQFKSLVNDNRVSDVGHHGRSDSRELSHEAKAVVPFYGRSA
jgi:hypothetical protein